MRKTYIKQVEILNHPCCSVNPALFVFLIRIAGEELRKDRFEVREEFWDCLYGGCY